MATDTYYFSHDYNARNDRKLVRVKLKHKMAGIGIYWSLIEMLYEEGGKLLLSDARFIASELREKQSKVESIIMDFELFQCDSDFFWSNSVLNRLEKRIEKSTKASESAKSRWEKHANVMRTHSDGNAIKERKGKEIKVKENIYIDVGKENIELKKEELNKLEEEFGILAAKKFIDYLSDYKTEKGYKSKSDYLTIRRWVIDAVNKKNGTHQPNIAKGKAGTSEARVTALKDWGLSGS